MNYKQYLLSDDWKQKRQRVFRIHGKSCMNCGKTESLEVHHLFYRKLYNASTRFDMMPLCRECHTLAHRNQITGMSIRRAVEKLKKCIIIDYRGLLEKALQYSCSSDYTEPEWDKYNERCQKLLRALKYLSKENSYITITHKDAGKICGQNKGGGGAKLDRLVSDGILLLVKKGKKLSASTYVFS